ncbi:hypothetical protein BDW02DRAFT_596727 [Decorospora gaudefroyi]|uniref:Uncharacterized protein n=1 Tax=Decorospora gaudefroyi TaxID=184978 RepID=A0A6A5KIY1_9PLEO|nr:hypothetical protein BDW02DRAFT_596727 [Decorospora gaudefroyi]
MSLRSFLTLSFYLKVASTHALKISTIAPSLTTKPPARRADESPIPTFTFGPSYDYLPVGVTYPEPSGTKIQIYPTGVYEGVPEDGITIAFGPKLREQIESIRSQKCKTQQGEDCRHALSTAFSQTDISTHLKRYFILLAWAIGIALGGLIAQYYLMQDTAMPEQIKFRLGDLSQIKSLAGAPTFAVVSNSDGDATPTTLTPQQPTTSTATSFISMETLKADKDGHKAGDIAYHIPKKTAERIQNFLDMTGLEETQKKCKGQSLKGSDPTRECAERILRHAMDLSDTGPANLLALAQSNIPGEPAAGKAIGFPIPDITLDDFLAFIQVYRRFFEAKKPAPKDGQEWDPIICYKSAVGLTIALHAVASAGQGLQDIYIDKNDLVNDFKVEKLACPNDLVCLSQDCQGQKPDTVFLTDQVIGETRYSRTPICIIPETYGCRCEYVNFAYVYESSRKYMDAQYEFLEWLAEKAEEGPDSDTEEDSEDDSEE